MCTFPTSHLGLCEHFEAIVKCNAVQVQCCIFKLQSLSPQLLLLSSCLSPLPHQQSRLDSSEKQRSTLVMVVVPSQVKWLQSLVVLNCHLGTVLNEE